jgi:hypothetical protein
MGNATYTSFSKRVLTVPPAIYGYQLKPLTLGHVLILRESNNGFINGEYNAFLDPKQIVHKMCDDLGVIPDFANAILICSVTHDEFLKEHASGEYYSELIELKKTFDANPQILIPQIQQMARYFHNGTQGPAGQPKAKSGEDGNLADGVIGQEQAMLFTLMKECGYTRDECLNTVPFTETLSSYLLYCHQMDAFELLSEGTCNTLAQLESLKTK